MKILNSAKSLIKLRFPAVFSALLIFAKAALAQDSFESPVQNTDDVIQFFYNVANWTLAAVALFSVLAFSYAGYLFMTAGDAQEKRTTAKRWLKWAIVGAVVYILSTGLINIINTFIQG